MSTTGHRAAAHGLGGLHPVRDTLSLAGLRAMADRAAGWAEAAGGRITGTPGLTLADAGSPCLFLNVAASAGPARRRSRAGRQRVLPAGRAFVLLSPRTRQPTCAPPAWA